MKLKFGHNNIELLNNSKIPSDVKVVFNFNTLPLPNAKKHMGSFKISKFDDLTDAGAVTKLNNGQIIVVSLGDKNSFNLSNYITALGTIGEVIKNNTKITSIDLIIEESLIKLLNQTINEFSENSVFHVLDSLYYFDDLKSQPRRLSLKSINVTTRSEQKAVLQHALNMAEGVFLIKDLAHGPANLITPTHLAKVAKGFEKLSKKVKVTILDEKDAKRLKMNTFLAVAQGADTDAKFITMEYSGAAKTKQPIVLIGKGVTFDTGGISLKPGANMDAMKYDMCGAATVIGIFQTVVNLGLNINLAGLIPTCENMPSGNALKPGDVITAMSGKTIEVLNTDAEGRLILCDALTYAAKYKPELVIDIATLTGACIIALGKVASGLYSNDDSLAEQLIKSGLHTDDKVWRMPLFKEYHNMLKSTIADVCNIGSWKGEAGSVTAACFLEEFTSYKWAHLDIAGPAMDGSGRPFYMLMHFLRNLISGINN